MAKNIVISGYYGFKNFGDEAILSVLTDKLKSLDTNITVLSSNPEWTSSTYDVKSVYSFDLKSIIKLIANSDILISGGGSLLQDVTSLKSLIYYLLIIFIAIFFRKKIIIFAQGIGPINNKLARWITMKLLKKCSYITVRDTKSFDLLSQYGVSAELVCDPIYSVYVPVKVKSGVGIQLRSFKTVSDDFLFNLAQQITNYFSNETIKVFSLQDALDKDVCNRFVQILKTLSPTINVELIAGLDMNETISQLSSLEYLIGMRFHALLVALKADVKSLAINYDIKVEKLANEAAINLISLKDFSDYSAKFETLKNHAQMDAVHLKQKKFAWNNFVDIIAK